MRHFLMCIAEAFCILCIFAISVFMIHAGAYVLSDGFGGSPVPGISAIVTGFLFFVIVIGNVIESSCCR